MISKAYFLLIRNIRLALQDKITYLEKKRSERTELSKFYYSNPRDFINYIIFIYVSRCILSNSCDKVEIIFLLYFYFHAIRQNS